MDRLTRSSAPMCRTDTLERLEMRVQGQLRGLVRDFCLRHRGEGLVLQGHAHTYHAKQLAQHAVMNATSRPIVANEIEVS